MLLPLLLVSRVVTVLFVAWLLPVLRVVPIGRMLLCTAPLLLGVPSVGEIRKALFVVFRLCLLDRTVFPVRTVLLGMAWLLVQLPGRLVKRAFVALLPWEQQFLLVRMVFLVRAVWLLVQCPAPLLVLCVAYRPQVLRRRQELIGKALLQARVSRVRMELALLVPLLDGIVRCVVWPQSEQQFLRVRTVCLPERLPDVA